MTNEQPVSIAEPSLRRAIFLAMVLVVIDALYLNQGAIALLVGLWLLFVGLPLTLLSKKYRIVRAQRLRDIAIYVMAVISVFAFNAANNRLAQNRTKLLVSAIKAFHTENKQYPQSLENLVPDYIEDVPLAKYTLIFNQFTYFSHDQDATLCYVSFPPFGRPTYSFKRDEWFYLD